MTDLVCCLSTGKGTWIEVTKVLNNHPWGNVFLVTNDFGKERFTSEKPVQFILVDVNMGVEAMKKTIVDALNGKLSGDVAVNLISGSGKEHMALLAALVQLGVGIRFTIASDADVKEI